MNRQPKLLRETVVRNYSTGASSEGGVFLSFYVCCCNCLVNLADIVSTQADNCWPSLHILIVLYRQSHQWFGVAALLSSAVQVCCVGCVTCRYYRLHVCL
jgi:hypothetical protein